MHNKVLTSFFILQKEYVRIKRKSTVIKICYPHFFRKISVLALLSTILWTSQLALLPNLLMHASKQKKSVLCPFLFQLLMIAGAPWFPLGPQKCSFEKLPRHAWRLPTSIFDAAAHFVCLPQESQPSPIGGLHTLASQLSGPFPAPAHCCPVCGSAAQLQGR